MKMKTMLQGYVSAAATSATNAAASEANAATSATNAANNAARSLGYQNAARAAAKEAEASQQEAKADADRAASASAHQPQISSDGYWELWDLTQGVYVKTAYQAQGPKGENGDSYTVKGLYATLSALQAAHPTGSAGDAWFVGTAEDNVVYQWDVDQAKWVNVGALKGPQGTAAGFGAPTATVDDNTGTPSVEVTASGPDTEKVFSFTFKNLKGAKGETGNTGAQGPTGPAGTNGATGADGKDGADGKSAYTSAQDGGYTGTEAQFNTDLAAVGGKQAKITASGILKGNGAGGVTTATKGTDYAGASETVTATLLAARWTGNAAPYSYTLTVSGVTATSNQEVLPALNITVEQLEALQSANIQDGGQAANTMTLKAYGDKPTIDLPIRVIKRGD